MLSAVHPANLTRIFRAKGNVREPGFVVRRVTSVALFAAGCGAGPADYVRPRMPQPDAGSQQAIAVPEVRAARDPELSARVIERRALNYAEGPDLDTGRPAHVRAGSGLVWVGSELAVIQDDALFLGLVSPSSARVSAHALPAGPGGARLFDDASGNKAHKLDLESAVFFDGRLFAFGSGSTPARELVVVIENPAGQAPVARLSPAHRLYAALRSAREFSGSELNIEGAALIEKEIVLAQRGNGRAIDGRLPVDATVRVDAARLAAYLDSKDTAPLPALESITRYALGAISDVRLTFTDLASADERLFYLAAAEASPDTVRDGIVVGTALGVISADGTRARYAPITDREGRIFTGKAEGLALDPNNPTRAWIVIDRDDPNAAAELCTLELRGI
jgi:hypothetical protein